MSTAIETPPPLRDISETPLERVLELVARFDGRGPRYTSYPTAPVWRRDLPREAHRAALDAVRRAGKPVALYLHFPFCALRCLYCGCNSVITSSPAKMDRYAEALIREVDAVADALGERLPHAVLHLGGGTPTHMPPVHLAAVLDRVLERFPGIEAAERSVEVDPRNCTDEHIALLAARGFWRLSVGVQDLDEGVQQAVRRLQPFPMVRDFIGRARAAGFRAVNVDLIYGLPRQTPPSWQQTLEGVLELGADRLACFGYAHMPDRIAHQRAIESSELPSADARIAMLIEARRFLCSRGYEAIGMDHFARTGDELARARREGRLYRNFMGYTTSRGLELIGLGCSAISEFQNLFCQNESSAEAYGELVRAGESAVVRGHELDDDDRYRKALITELMCNLDLRPAEIGAREGLPVPEGVRAALAEVAPYAADGVIEPVDGGYRVTSLGQLFLRNLAMPFDRYLPAQGNATFSRTV